MKVPAVFSAAVPPWRRDRLVPLLGALLLLALPPLATLAGEPFLVSSFTRILVYGLAAAGLDLILGYGGMVSFGHAAFFGVGAYAAGILTHHAWQGDLPGLFSGPLAALPVWGLAILAAALAAAVIGAMSLRTGGVYFIMITLAFAQMLFFLAVSLEGYGGADGLLLPARNALPGVDVTADTPFYYLCLGLLALFLLLCRHIVASRFGMVIQGARQNARRMTALGYPVWRYRLVCFTLAGAGAGLAGALAANHATYVSPDLLHWSNSGEIMAMVILGGMGTLYGPVLGAAAFLLLSEFLPLLLESAGFPGMKEHWRLLFGPLLVLVVLYGRGGLYGLLAGRKAADG